MPWGTSPFSMGLCSPEPTKMMGKQREMDRIWLHESATDLPCAPPLPHPENIPFLPLLPTHCSNHHSPCNSLLHWSTHLAISVCAGGFAALASGSEFHCPPPANAQFLPVAVGRIGWGCHPPAPHGSLHTTVWTTLRHPHPQQSTRAWEKSPESSGAVAL